MSSPARTPIALIFTLWLAGLCAAAQFAKISLIFPELQTVYPGHGTAAGFLVTLISFMGVVLGLFTGMIVARFGFRKPLISALLLGAALSAMQATLPPFPVMLASRFAEGLSHLAIVVAAPTLIARVSTDKSRPLTMTLWGTFFGVAFALVGFLGLPLVRTHGIPALFMAHAVAMLAVAAALWAMLPRSEVQVGAIAGLSFTEVVARHVETYRSPSMSAPALGWLFYTLSFVSMLTVLPGLLPQDQRAVAASTMPLAGIAISLTLGMQLLRHTTAVQVVKLGFLLSAVCMLLMWVFDTSGWVAIALFAVLGLVQGATFAAVPQLNHDARHQAYANGAMAQMGNLGNLTGTVVLLWLLQNLGHNGLIIFGLACFVSGLAVHLWLHHKRTLTRVDRH
jgi:MFS transporter, DHA1 family, inner membrane transport protein